MFYSSGVLFIRDDILTPVSPMGGDPSLSSLSRELPRPHGCGMSASQSIAVKAKPGTELPMRPLLPVFALPVRAFFCMYLLRYSNMMK